MFSFVPHPFKYHALSMASQAGYDVDLVGFSGSSPCDEVLNHPNIRLQIIPTPEIPKLMNRVFFTRAIYKTIVQLWLLFSLLMFKIAKPTYILCQNPPAIPLLAVALLVSIFRGSKFVIDWHNYGYTWLAVNRPGSSLLVGLYYIYERIFGRLAHGHLCVSHAMKADLKQNWGINANVLHDLPQPFFKRASSREKKQLFDRHEFGKATEGSPKNVNAFCLEDGSLRPDRPALLVSSTSWTADEDFSVLLDAVEACDKRAKEGRAKFPLVRLVVTGKGDLKEFYERKIAALDLKYFTFYTEFLSFADYALLLGSADLGVSLHFSSSKLDLPMKVVDMFGSELPVAAYDYGCLGELVKDGVNGFTFTTREKLTDILYNMLIKFPEDLTVLEACRDNIREFKKAKWSDTWSEAAIPIFGHPQGHEAKDTSNSPKKATRSKGSAKSPQAARQRINSSKQK